MPKIVLLAPFDPRPSAMHLLRSKYGGVERYVHGLSTSLVRLGFSVLVVASSFDNGSFVEAGVEYRLIRRWGLPHGTPFFRWPRALLGNSGHILHVQATYPLLTDVASFLAHALGSPSVATCHFDVVGRDPREAALAGWYYRLIGRRGYAAYDRIIYTTHDYAEFSLSAPSVDPRQIRIVPMGVDTSLFHIIPEVAKDRSILFVGRLTWFKGVDVLLDAFARMNPLDGWTLRIVGEGPEAAALELRIQARGLRAEILRDVTDEELVRLYNAASLTVLPSVAPQESFGTTLIESMACGTPVVASGWPGVRVVAALGGSVVAPRDSGALAEAISESVAQEMSIAEREALSQRIAHSYRWDEVARRTAEVYRELS